MKKFVLKTAVFAAIVLCMVYGIELLRMQVPHPVSIKAKYIATYPGSIRTMILGNSQGYFAFVPELLGDSTFNNAYCSKNPYYDYKMLKEEVSSLSNLRCVIWNISYNFHTFDLQHVHGYERDSQAYIRNKLYKYFGIEPSDGLAYIFWWENIWGWPDGPFLTLYLNREEFNYSTGGWWANPKRENVDLWEEMSKKPLETDFYSEKSKETLRENIQYASKIAEICQANDLRLIVVSLPCHESFTSRNCEAGLNEMRMCVEAMKEKCPEMEFYDYMYDLRFDEEDYFDSTHLNTSGARKFTEIFKEEIYLPDLMNESISN